MDEHNFDWKTLDGSAKGADKRRGKGHIPIDHRRRAEPRIHLNQLYVQSFCSEEAFALRDILWHRRVAPARVSDSNSLRRVSAHGLAVQKKQLPEPKQG